MTAACVCDASAALALILRSQETAASVAFGAQLPGNMFVPVHFSIEVRQALTKLERRGVIPEAALDEPLGQLETGLTLGPPLEAHDLARILALARHDRLAFYDAVYLDMAVESGVPLASRDGPLLAAATRLGVPVIDLR